MKTWEVIKELTENPNKKFKRVGDELEVSLDSDNSLLWKSGHAPFNINHVWKEVKEPVDFMEALNDGNRIRPKSWRSEHCLAIDDLLYEISDMDEEEIRQLLNGEWYVE